ncbi:MAG: S8 family peptidase [Pseudorhizobium sp.]
MPNTALIGLIALFSAGLMVSGCSGGSGGSADGGSGNSSPPAVAAPAPVLPTVPAPPPPPSAPSLFQGDWTSGGVTVNPTRAEQIRTSVEFRAADANCAYVGCASSGAPASNHSSAFELHNLHTALSSGISGAKQLVAVVDSGFRTTHQEFAGKAIYQYGTLPSSDHGTHVASLIAGAQDGKGMHGVAPSASLHLTAINPAGGTSLNLDNVIGGTLDAASRGAVAQNNSWGFELSASDFASHLQANPGRTVAQGLNALIGNYGAAKWQTYLDALDGFQRGGVIVWALSNDETMTSGDVMAALPHFDQRLQGAWVAAANGYFEVDAAGDITKAVRLSAACGLAASFCIAGDGTTSAASATSDTSYSAGTGTSYVAPQIAGTVALLAEAFPDLTPEEWTKRLLASADNSWFSKLGVAVSGTSDFGNGVSHVFSEEWGHGVLDIAAALSPIGSVSYLSGDHVLTSSRTSLSEMTVAPSQSFGDGIERALAGTQVAVFDALNRSYNVEGSHLVEASSSSMLPDLMQWVAVSPSHALPRPGLLLSEDTYAATAGLSVAADATGIFDTSPARAWHSQSSVLSLVGGNVAAISSHEVGPFAITAVGFAGEGTHEEQLGSVAGGGINFAIGGATRFSLGLSYLDDQQSLLGMEPSAAFAWGSGSKVSTFHAGLDHQLAPGLGVFGRLEHGTARASGGTAGLIGSISDVDFSAFQVGVRIGNVVRDQDSLSFSVAQPLRIESGSMKLNIPTGRNAGGEIQQRQMATDVEPTGRELDLGLDYNVPVGEGHLRLGLQYRVDAGHVPDASAAGLAIGFRKRF